MKIGIASDHRGVILKEKIKNYLNDRYQIIDYGTNSIESVDYPQYAYKIGESVRDNKIDLGILICGTGIGMSIACNKVKKVRCAKVTTKEEAFLARSHNNANVIALSENITNYKEIIDTFLTTDFSNEEKHIRRVEMIDNYDN
mgnify:FL=1